MSKPTRAADSPFMVNLEEGKTYYWCSCGLSKTQPLCDGSHKDSSFTPVKYDALKNKKQIMCGCKQTKKPPYCDGSHNTWT
ncbi:CDGSH iron-sulfur domain-containing protein [Oceanicoccus sagamiensis]|uniref:Glutamate synthase n=1 Tax=Oceanicoccus sagamiensis TaxID=716816 RepID=A0A1X9N978_9GAMM|nr:CDGSH iron-sulfur domain-containing protein [Oceanicoccus sagamiensis]ARN74620.1 glutamate synthase [Oceanicoccus sagamiensis]